MHICIYLLFLITSRLILIFLTSCWLCGPYGHIKIDTHSLPQVFDAIKVPLIAHQHWFTSIYMAHQSPQQGLDKEPCLRISPRFHHDAWDVGGEPKWIYRALNWTVAPNYSVLAWLLFLYSFSSEPTTYNVLYRSLQIPIVSQCTDHHANSPLFHHDNWEVHIST